MKKFVFVVLGVIAVSGLVFAATPNFRKVDNKLAVDVVETIIVSRDEATAKVSAANKEISELQERLIRLAGQKDIDISTITADYNTEVSEINDKIAELTQELEENTLYITEMDKLSISEAY